MARDREDREQTDGLSRGDIAELKRLRAEVAELRMERDVLKRSVALWAKEATKWVWRGSSPPRGRAQRSPHTLTCALLGVSIGWYYKWIARAETEGPHTNTDRRRAALDAAVAEAFATARGLYVSPRIHAEMLIDARNLVYAVSVCSWAMERPRSSSNGLAVFKPSSRDLAISAAA